MHPIERLRHVARVHDAPVDEVVRAAAASLAGFSDDPVALVPACRRLIERHPANAAIWWLCGRVVSAADPADEAWRCLDEWVADPTVAELRGGLPVDATVVVVGAPERLLPAFAARGDVGVVVAAVDAAGHRFARQLDALDVESVVVEVGRWGEAVTAADLVVLDATLLAAPAVLAPSGSWPVAALAHTAGVAVWAVGGVGRTVTPGGWDAVVGRLGGRVEVEAVPPVLVDVVIGPGGPEPAADALARADVVDVVELRR